MKTSVLFIVVLGICSFFTAQACPVFHIADIRVIDQDGKSINNAEVYRFYSRQDSFKLGRDTWRLNYYDTQREIDSGLFSLISGGLRLYNETTKPSDKYFLVRADGYADVKIKSVNFSTLKRKNWDVPILEVVMYAKKIVRANNEYRVYESFYINDIVKVVDSLRIDMKDYLKDIQSDEPRLPGAEMSQVSVKAFPNPVREELHIQFGFIPESPHRIVLYDAQGKLLSETITEDQNYKLLVSWYPPGTYIIGVYDPKNTPLLRQQIIHQ